MRSRTVWSSTTVDARSASLLAQLAAARRGAPRPRAHALDRVPARPVGDDLVNAPRQPLALGQQPLERRRGGPLARIQLDDLAHGARPQRRQRDTLDASRVELARHTSERDRRRVVAADEHDQQRARAGRGDQLNGIARDARGRPIKVVDHEQPCPRGSPCPRERGGGISFGRLGPNVDDSGPCPCSSRASSATSRVLPTPRAPVTSSAPPRPSRTSRHAARSRSSSARRPASVGEPCVSSTGSSLAGSSSAGSWRRIDSCSRRSSGPGSTPTCSTSAARAAR